jgi:hypothetical protein
VVRSAANGPSRHGERVTGQKSGGAGDTIGSERTGSTLAARLVFTDPVDWLWLSDHFGLLAEVEIGQQE